jgi:hypothetical protein
MCRSILIQSDSSVLLILLLLLLLEELNRESNRFHTTVPL